MLTNEEKITMLQKLRAHFGLARNKDFADWLGISEQCAYGWMKAGSFDAEKVFERSGGKISAAWLLTGKGEMLQEKIDAQKKAEIMNKAAQVSTPNLQDEVQFLRKELSAVREQLSKEIENVRFAQMITLNKFKNE